MASYSSILACEIPWTEEPGRLQSLGSGVQRKCLGPVALFFLVPSKDPHALGWHKRGNERVTP